MADILRERLSLALDQSAGFERQVSALQTELGKFQAQLEIVTLDRDKAREELQRLKDEHSEDVVIHRAIEFRRGKRTRGVWSAFCPKCHLPILEYADHTGVECSGQCGFYAPLERHLDAIVSSLSP